jgi:hypothetical protein
LGIDISSEMNKTWIGLDGNSSYIPTAKLLPLVTIDRIKETLPKAAHKDDFIQYIQENMVLFAITLLTLSGQSERRYAMESFMEFGLTDECLPSVENGAKEGVCVIVYRLSREWNDNEELVYSDTQKECNTSICNHSYTADAFHDPVWNSTNLMSFFRNLRPFRLPKFDKQTFLYTFTDEVVLPFVNTVVPEEAVDEDEEGSVRERTLAQGHFGSVFRAAMIADHQNALQQVHISPKAYNRCVRIQVAN